MARGDSPLPSERPTHGVVLAVLGLVALVAALVVVATTRACESWTAVSSTASGSGPYLGASTAAAQLSWRDTARLRSGFGVPLALDPTAASTALDAALRARGYGAPSERLGPMPLPADVDVASLDRACGLLVLTAEGTSRLVAAGRPAGLRSADDPSTIALGVCGRGPFRVEGVGSVRADAILVPGLVEDDVERLGLPEDVLLAHVEAERLLRGVAYLPSDELVRLEATGAAASSGELPALPSPPTGCVPWAVVVVGAGLLRPTLGTWPADYGAQRGLGLAVSCAGDPSTYLGVSDDGTPGYVAWARPYASTGAPSLPAPDERSIERARVVAASAIRLPASFPVAR